MRSDAPALSACLAMGRRGLLRFGAAVAVLGSGLSGARAAAGLKVAAVFSTPIEEPWDNQIHVALLKAKQEHGIDYQWSENVASADFGRVLREYAEKGTGLIMGDAFEAEQMARRVARLVNAFNAGAREANPAVKCKVTFIGSFFDPPKAKEAALAQIDAGADVLYAERFGVIEAAKEKGVLAISNMSDQSSLAPDTVVTGPVWDMWPTVDVAVRTVTAGVYTAQDLGSFSTMTKGGSFLAPFHAWEQKLPVDVKDLVAKKRDEILAGDFRVTVDESTPKSD